MHYVALFETIRPETPLTERYGLWHRCHHEMTAQEFQAFVETVTRETGGKTLSRTLRIAKRLEQYGLPPLGIEVRAEYPPTNGLRLWAPTNAAPEGWRREGEFVFGKRPIADVMTAYIPLERMVRQGFAHNNV